MPWAPGGVKISTSSSASEDVGFVSDSAGSLCAAGGKGKSNLCVRASMPHLRQRVARPRPALRWGWDPRGDHPRGAPSLAGKQAPSQRAVVAGTHPPMAPSLAGKHGAPRAVTGKNPPSTPRRRWLASTPPIPRRHWLESTLPSCCRWLASTRMDSPRSRFWLAMTHPMPPVAGRAQRPATPHCTHNLGPAQA